MRAFVRSTDEHPIIRANRQELREIWSTGLDIQWDRLLVTIEEVNQKVKLVFEDGQTAVGDVLVGADGVGSFGKLLLTMSVHCR
jgi:2-polyprenyl-6-methoxyphenol hydroxylase-like FAD-dependent oxidoreductase